jgi:4-hydroxybenzoate polyprenyltransferase
MLCMTISGTYLVNDLADLASDRAHPVKKMRALASGAISAPVGLGLGIALVVLGVAGAFFLAADFGILLSLYVALSLAYSVRLREFALLDVIVIGTLFTLRVLMGIVLADVPISPWLLSFSMFLFTSLALAKRHGELLRMREADMTVIGRGYQASDWPLTMAFGVAASVASLQVMLIYLAQEAATHYATPAWLALAPAMVLIWLCRIWLLAHRGVLADDPVAFALKDPVSIGLGVLVVAGFVLAL